MNINNFINEDHEGFYYDPLEGRLYRIQEIDITFTDSYDDKVRGTRRTFKGKSRPCTHIIFFIMTGRWPIELIDHKNNNGLDNRWENIREATYEQNAHNRRPQGSMIYDGLETGVEPTPFGKYRVKVKGKYIATFDDKAQANECARKTRRLMYGDFDVNNNREDTNGPQQI